MENVSDPGTIASDALTALLQQDGNNTIRIPVMVHLVTTGKYASTRSAADVAGLVERIEQIWTQANILLDLKEVVTDPVPDAALEEAFPREGAARASARSLLMVPAYDPDVLNLFLVGYVPVMNAKNRMNSTYHLNEKVIILADRTSITDVRVAAYTLALILGLTTVDVDGRLMQKAREGTLLVEPEIQKARAAAERLFPAPSAAPIWLRARVHLVDGGKYGAARPGEDAVRLLDAVNRIWAPARIELQSAGVTWTTVPDAALEAAFPNDPTVRTDRLPGGGPLSKVPDFDPSAINVFFVRQIPQVRAEGPPQRLSTTQTMPRFNAFMVADSVPSVDPRPAALALGYVLCHGPARADLSEAEMQIARRFVKTQPRLAGVVTKTRAVFQAPKPALSAPGASAPTPPAKTPASAPAPAPTAKAPAPGDAVDAALAELNALIGLQDVKSKINTLANFLKMEKVRQEMGLSRNPMTLHSVFSGGPGTGKTTVARLFGRILREIGLLPRGHVVEVDRASLVQPGKTGALTIQACEEATDGILFIDEAYTLAPGPGRDSFGVEAIDVIVKFMEDKKDRLLVIVAGYDKEMAQFLDANAGLKSRFTQYFDFADYTPEQMVAIYQHFCRAQGFALADDVADRLHKVTGKAYDERDKTFGNARAVRNLFEESLARQADRLVGSQSLTREQVTTLTVDDIPEMKLRPAAPPEAKVLLDPASLNIISPPLGDTIENVLAELDAMIGMDNVKQQVRTLINFLKVEKKRKESGLERTPISLHMVFTGPPGTGKTTVARFIGRIYKCLDFLPRGHVLETDRSGMVAGYVGQTAIKVNQIVDRALDGVLFIDEAYELARDVNTGHAYGMEAISTLLKRMEDARDRLAVVVAGYPKNMEEFLEANSGLKSRFNQKIEFVDYQPEELAQIFDLFCSSHGFTTGVAAKAKLLGLFQRAYDQRDQTFGNGRMARNLFEKSLERQANRVVDAAPGDGVLTTLEADDIPDLQAGSAPVKRIGFRQSS